MKTIGGSILLLAASVFGLAGCATPKSPPPPAVLNLTGTHPAAEVTLHTVIATGGPNTWAPDAPWDEYVLTIINRSAAPFTLESARVFDLLDRSHGSDVDPQKLSIRSRENWRVYQTARVPVFPKRLELTGTEKALVVPAAILEIANPVEWILLPVGSAIGQERARKTRKEFADRQLTLPLLLQPGQSATGSVFFPMIPGPRRLELQGLNGGKPVQISIQLTGLSRLHLLASP